MAAQQLSERETRAYAPSAVGASNDHWSHSSGRASQPALLSECQWLLLKANRDARLCELRLRPEGQRGRLAVIKRGTGNVCTLAAIRLRPLRSATDYDIAMEKRSDVPRFDNWPHGTAQVAVTA